MNAHLILHVHRTNNVGLGTQTASPIIANDRKLVYPILFYFLPPQFHFVLVEIYLQVSWPLSTGTITWNANTSDGVRARAVYRFDDSTQHWVLKQVLAPHTSSLTVEPGQYALTAVNRVGRESNAQTVIVTTPLVG